jgi:anaerobic selenocysteine-containing dehydrogenase
MVEIETASFWYDSPEVKRGELTTEEIDTEVFLFPAAGHAEKEGSFTQTQRTLQWREKAVSPPEDARSDAWFVHQLAKRLKAKAEASNEPRDDALRALDWWYPEDAHGEPLMEAVLAEINGWRVLERADTRSEKASEAADDDIAHGDAIAAGVDAGSRASGRQRKRCERRQRERQEPQEKERALERARRAQAARGEPPAHDDADDGSTSAAGVSDGSSGAELTSAQGVSAGGAAEGTSEQAERGEAIAVSAPVEGVVYGNDREGRPHHGPQLNGMFDLRDDGSTACGCWIYSGVFGPDGVNRALRREPRGPLAHGWGWAWPADRRILYNRASARPDGAPWSDRKKLVWWDDAERKWMGDDVPDFPSEKPPDYRPPEDAKGMDAHAGDAPFILHEDGLGWLFAPGAALADGPLPTHYEPLESPMRNPLYSVQNNPVVNWFARDDNRFAATNDPRFPYVLTTYRLTEHHTAGGMSRFLSHLAELQPELFAEMSPELAAEVGVENSDWVTIATPRGAVEARALVTRRIRPMRLGDRVVHQIAMPFHWGSAGPVTGDVTNDLIALSGEPNVTIHESKALTCMLRKGRRPPDAEIATWLAELQAMGRPGPEREEGEDGGGHGEHGTAES